MNIELSNTGITLAYLQTVFPNEKFLCVENVAGEEGVHVFVGVDAATRGTNFADFIIAPLRPTTKAAEPILADKWLICFKYETPAHEDVQADIDYEEFRSIEWLAATKQLRRCMALPKTQIFDGFEQAACCLPVVLSQMRTIEARSLIDYERQK
jgi:hypothetical protein